MTHRGHRARTAWARAGAALSGIAVLGACLLALTGCGGSNVLDPVAQAASVSTGAPGYRMTMSMQISIPTLSAAVTATGNGAFDLRDHAGSFALDMNVPQGLPGANGGTFHLEEIIRPGTVYMKLPSGLGGSVGGGKPWVKIDVAKAAAAAGISGMSSLTQNPISSDPSQFLQYLRAVSGDVTLVGGDWVNGQSTTHYRATISLDRIASALPASMRDSAQRALSQLQSLAHLTGLPIDVWVDTHHLVRRIVMSFGGSSLAAAGVGMTMQMDIPQYGPQPLPALPPADQVGSL